MLSKKYYLIIGFPLLIIGVVVLFVLSQWSINQLAQDMLALFYHIKSIAAIHPFFYTLSIAILPAIGVPVSPLYILGAVLYGFPNALYWGIPGLFLNLLLIFAVSQKYFRPTLVKIMHHFGHKVWKVDPKEGWRVTILVRAAVAVPIAIQSYVLCLGGIPLLPYLVISVPVEACHMTVFCLSAQGLGSGHWGWIITGLSLIVIVSVLPHFIKKWYGRKSK